MYRRNLFTCGPYPFYKLNPYRRNSNVRLRQAEQRYRASSDFLDKLNYNIVSLRSGIIPPPDVEVEIIWNEESILGQRSLYPELSHLMQPGKRHRWHRKWYFPNGLGLVASYNIVDPFPGQSRDTSNIPVEEHEMETIVFTWVDTKTGQSKEPMPVDHFYGFDSSRLRVIQYPQFGAPENQFLSHTVIRFPLIDEATLLEVLQETASTRFENRYQLFAYEDDEED